jgi:3(or 17)beta-hydroxysteroid dehydrogenase
MQSLKNKVILVTGAASGLGLADAALLASFGAKVVMTDVNAEGEQLANDIGADFLVHDVAEESQWHSVMQFVEEKHGRIDGLVNNAGIAIIANIETTTTEMWRKTLAIHLDGTFFGCQAAIPLMKASGGGSIVNMSSTAALVGIPAYLAYTAAKGGIRSMTKAIAIHCRNEKLGIRCNSVHPGSISTPMVHDAVKDLIGVDLVNQEDPEATRQKLGIGEPNDVAHMVAYLLSDEAKHVTGAEMVVDNGDTVV